MDLTARIKHPLSEMELKNALLNRTKIITYNQLKNYKSINSLLHPYNNVIILYEWAPCMGHWVCLSKHKNGDVDFFDPYGYMPDDEREFIPDKFWETNYLSQLLADYPGRVFYNQYPLQSKDKLVATCGRWVLLRLLKPELSLDNFIFKMNQISSHLRDKVITLITDKFIK